MKIPFFDLTEQYRAIKDQVEDAVKDILDSQQFILGPKVEELEKRVAEYCGSRYAVGVSSGTDALLVSMMAEGIGQGDLVITTPYTFIATADSIAMLGAMPIFVDIDEKTFNMDTEALENTIRSLSPTKRAHLKAIIPVHLYGQCANMEDIVRIARFYGLAVIEDAAQAIGSEYVFSDGMVCRAGSMGDYGCFSFFPTKNLGGIGDGGMVVTDNEKAYEILKSIRVHGSKRRYFHDRIGGNFRLDALQAAVLLVKFEQVDRWTEQRIGNANLYRTLLSDLDRNEIFLPVDNTRRHVYNQFVIKVPLHRDRLKNFLLERGIGTEVYYPLPLHMQKCFEYLGYGPDSFPVSLEASRTTLALPVYPELRQDHIRCVAEEIHAFFEK